MHNPWLLDGLVILAYFVVVISIGLYKGRGEKSMEGFAVGDRNIPWWAVLASILAAEVSAGTFLGTPGEGLRPAQFHLRPARHRHRSSRASSSPTFSSGDFYDCASSRFTNSSTSASAGRTKLASSAVFLITRALASGSRMFVPAILLVVAWQLIKRRASRTARRRSGSTSARSVSWCSSPPIYTTFGGIKAVVWTDLLQVFLMFGAMFYATWTLWHAVGGWEVVKTVATTTRRRRGGRARALSAARAAMAEAAGPRASARGIRAAASRPRSILGQRIEKDPVKRAQLGFWGNVKNVLETEYTVFYRVPRVRLRDHGHARHRPGHGAARC